MKSIVWVLLLAAAGAAVPQEHRSPTPRAEVSLLRQFEGEWDALSQVVGMSDRESHETNGRETARMGVGGLWLCIEFHGDIDDTPFEARGQMGYDPMTRKYVMSWVDSVSPRMKVAEGWADSSGKVFTLRSECRDPLTEHCVRETLVLEIRDRDHRTLRATVRSREGDERQTMQILYTRRK
ncbi:MAG TPA: DUF1579 domain-containing protein [Planctomycetota bacterium]|nr:DUF1579 domain-containing protein [Planctomycetota bacterium]